MPGPLISRARERAKDDVQRFVLGVPDGEPRKRHLAIGDPQASFEKVLRILERHHMLGHDGRLRRDVRLTSIGDHFDWGAPEEREQATREGLELLAWLASHPSDQTTLIFGNHDVARLGELAAFDDEQFRLARSEADRAYRRGKVDTTLEHELLTTWPMVSDAESLARNYSTFSTAQRTWVHKLLLERRATLAHAEAPDLLMLHAGLSAPYLAAIGLREQENDAYVIAEAVAEFLDVRLRSWSGNGPLDLQPLHRAGSRDQGEGRGFLHHRPSHPDCSDAEMFVGPPQRRFDARTLPKDLTQVIGHIRDTKSRRLLAPWVKDSPDITGVLRSLVTNGIETRYQNGVVPRPPGFGELIFIDGSMSTAEVDDYALFDVTKRDTAR